MAIDSSARKALPVKYIYKWITDNFPYYKDAPIGWKNSVRHNLSLNRCFVKTRKNYNLLNCSFIRIEGERVLSFEIQSYRENFSKGFLWTIDTKFHNNILQTINNQNLLLTQPELLLERDKSIFHESESNFDDIDAAAVISAIKHNNIESNVNNKEEKEKKVEQFEKVTGSLKRKRSVFEMKKNTTYSDNTLFQNYRRRNTLILSGKMSEDHNYTSETVNKNTMDKEVIDAKENSNEECCVLNKDDVDGISALLNLSRNSNDHIGDDQIRHECQEIDQGFQPRLLKRSKRIKGKCR